MVCGAGEVKQDQSWYRLVQAGMTAAGAVALSNGRLRHAFGVWPDPQERLCYMTVSYDHFEAGQRYRLEARSLAFTPSARLINRQGQIVAKERQINCVP